MQRLAFTVERDAETGALVASWDDNSGGGITTEADSLAALERSIQEAVRCHFGDGTRPHEVTLHFDTDLVLQVA